MHEWQTLSHVRWECKDHVVTIPQYRKKVLYGRLKRQSGAMLRELCRQKGGELVAGHCMPDHIHLCLRLPPKYSVAYTLGFLKGKSAVRIHRELLQERRVTGLPLWAAGYCVSLGGWTKLRSARTSASRKRWNVGKASWPSSNTIVRSHRDLPQVHASMGGFLV